VAILAAAVLVVAGILAVALAGLLAMIDLKRFAIESGFKEDDGLGNPQCNEWDNLRLFAHKIASDERE
jgi:hypothetical protein